MKAAVVREHGGPDRLNFESNFPDPRPGEGDVIVAVKASSLDYHDVFTRRGMPGIKVPMPAIMGLDVAGEIAEIGPGVTGWKKGDRVVVDPINRIEGGLMGETIHGGLAELCRARAHQLVRIPDGVSFTDAAALPCAYGTALRMMTTNGHVAKGEKVLILARLGRCRRVLPPDRQGGRRRGDRLRRHRRQGQAPDGARGRQDHQLHRQGFHEGNFRCTASRRGAARAPTRASTWW